MHHEGDTYVSLLDFIEILCKIDKNETILTIANDFCNFLTTKYCFVGNKCFKAEASDKTKHILLPVDLVLQIFISENFAKYLVLDSFDSNINLTLSKNYVVSSSCCCCCPKKLKKALYNASSFTEFVKQGEVELRRFQKLKPKINYLISLDIEAFEHSIDKLLEFGISIYDLSSKSANITHIIVTDHIHLRNGRFVADNRDKFNFGHSRYLPLKSALDHVLAVLLTPNSCLVGHNIKADIKFLKSVSKEKFDLPIFDTQLMYKQATLNENLLGLIRVLDEIGISHSNLHNAGNDAYYTLEIFKRLTQI